MPLRRGGNTEWCVGRLRIVAFLGYDSGTMRLEYYPVEKLKGELLKIIGRHLELSQYRVFFFGSRVVGGGSDRSDIDVGIEGDAPIPAAALIEIEEDVERLPTLYKIDIVDFSSVSEKFRSVALKQREFMTTP